MQTSSLNKSPHPPTLWFGLISGPLVWTIYFIIGYALIEAACKTTLLDEPIQQLDGIAFTILILTGVGMLLALVGTLFNLRHWRQIKQESIDSSGGRTESVRGYMAFTGLLLNLIFGFTIVFTGVAALFLNPC